MDPKARSPQTDTSPTVAARYRSVRPKDAATLILVRGLRGLSDVEEAEVLMGHRRTRDAWSNLYVFPGGRVDRGDHGVEAASELRPAVLERLRHAATPIRSRALAIAAIRETFEETGLRIARRATHPPRRKPRSAEWRQFCGEDGLWRPALAELHLLCRAVTPPRRPKRFDARFFLAEADAVGEAPKSNGELGDLRWLALGETRSLPLPKITSVVLEELRARLATGALETPRRTPLFRTVGKRHRRLEE